jgi:hypothetical protein
VQFTDNLVRDAWEPEAGIPTETDGYRQLVLPAPPTARLYRLFAAP